MFKSSTGRLGTGSMALSLLIFFLINFITSKTITTLTTSAEARTQSATFLGNLQKLESLLKDAETGVRGYLLTRQAPYLDPYNTAVENVDSTIKTLTASGAYPRHIKSINTLRELANQNFDILKAQITGSPDYATTGAANTVSLDRGKQIMDQIRHTINGAVIVEQKQHDLIDQKVRNATQNASVMIIGGTCSGIIVMLLGFGLLWRLSKDRDLARLALKSANEELELQVEMRTKDLRESNDKLKSETEFCRLAQENAQGQKLFLDALLDSLEEGIVACDEAGNLTVFNEASKSIHGLEEHHSSPENWNEPYNVFEADGITPLKTERVPLYRALQGELVQDQELIIIPKDGVKRLLVASGRCILDDNNRKLGAVVALRDLTKIREAEQIRKSIEQTDLANNAKTEFLSRMSHELRTPLNAILGFAQVLEMDGLQPNQGESVDQILKGGRHLLAMINDILDITRIEAGNLSISKEPVALDETIEETMKLVAPLASIRGISVIREEPGTNRYVLADRQRLKQVLLNLLSNAIKYNVENGSITISVKEADGRITTMISDAGGGIAKDKMLRLFSPFDRLGAETMDIEGTGLGLSLSKSLVELMGGQIGADSNLGVGSSFWFSLQQVEAPEHQLEEKASVASITTRNGDQRIKIIYIEDNASNFKLIERALVFRPHVDLIPAIQGTIGLELAEQHHPHMIFLDLNLPDIHGSEVLTRLRLNPKTRHIPVVIISADATARQVERMLAGGAEAYLTKPVELTAFLKLIDAIPSDSRE